MDCEQPAPIAQKFGVRFLHSLSETAGVEMTLPVDDANEDVIVQTAVLAILHSFMPTMLNAPHSPAVDAFVYVKFEVLPPVELPDGSL